MATCQQLYKYSPDWDTGYCHYCGKELSDDDRTKAVNGRVRQGMDSLYSHQWCFDFNNPIFITPAMVREKWYETHPELWDD